MSARRPWPGAWGEQAGRAWGLGAAAEAAALIRWSARLMQALDERDGAHGPSTACHRRRRRCLPSWRRLTASCSPLPPCPFCSKLASYTAPKSLMNDLPVQEDGDEVRALLGPSGRGGAGRRRQPAAACRPASRPAAAGASHLKAVWTLQAAVLPTRCC